MTSLACALLFCFPVLVNAAVGKPVKKILIFTSYPMSYQWTLDIVQSVKDAGKDSGFNIQYDLVDLNAMRVRDQQEWQHKFDQEAERLATHRYDLIIAIDTEAAELVLKNAAVLSGVPVILAEYSDEMPVFDSAHANFTGVFWSLDIRRTIASGRKLMPEAAVVYILTDSTPTGERARDYWFRELSNYTGCPLVFLSGTEYSTPQLIEKIRSANTPGFAILTPWRSLYRNDYRTLPAFGTDLEQSTNRPFFACTDTLFGSGLLGGYLTEAGEVGRLDGQQMNTILAHPGKALPPPLRCEPVPVFDYEQMQRFNLNPDDLPDAAVLRNEPLSLWASHSKEIRLAGAALLFLFGGILCYVYAVRRNMRRYRQLAQENQRNLQLLQENMQLWDTAINTLPVYFFVKDASRDFQYLESNQPWRDFLRCPREEINTKTDYAIFPHDTAEAIRQDDQTLMRANSLQETTLAIPGPDGETHYLRFLRQPFTTISGKRLLLGAAVDITEMEHAKQHLEGAMQAAEAGNQAKNFFIASVSHEIRTPLNAVIGFSELLRNSEVDRATQKEYLGAIGYSGKALLELLNDVLDLSKLESGQTSVTPEAVDLAAHCAAIVQLFQPAAAQKNVTCQLELAQLPVVHIDPLRLRQILFNLLGNAIKVTEAGQTICLAGDFQPGERQTGTLCFSVRDRGPVLTREMAEHIFEPFWKSATRGAATTVDTPTSDTGLGLAIAARLVRSMEGSIAVEPLTDGNIFRVEFPEVRYEKMELSTAVAIAAERGPDYSVLLVDDVAMNLKVLAAMLRKLEVKITTASSAEEALALFKEQHFDLILTDLWMPGMNGVELAGAIHRFAGKPPVPLVAITADIESRNNFDMSYFSAILAKPVTLQQLEKLLPPRRAE